MSNEKIVGTRLLWIFIGILLILSAINSYYIYNLNDQVSDLKKAVKDLPKAEGSSVQTEIQGSSFTTTEKDMPIVAVSEDEMGMVDKMRLKLIPGSNDILINTNPFLEPDVQYAVKTAVTYAISRTPDYGYDKDFIFDFNATEAQLIGGESAGASATILSLAALENKEIKRDSVITGTINPDGTVGRVGSVLEKAKAVSDAGYKYFLVPEGQSEITYYERQVQRQSTDFGFDILRSKYVPKTLDLAKEAKDAWDLNIVEVKTIDDALPYFISD
jgi:predicted S18 family serine protease